MMTRKEYKSKLKKDLIKLNLNGKYQRILIFFPFLKIRIS